MKTNQARKIPVVHTAEGAPAKAIGPLQELQRSLAGCLLWEDEFYEDGVAIADRIAALVPQCDPQEVALLAIATRNQQHLRHAPLLLCRELARHPKLGRGMLFHALCNVIKRADEPGEFLALYWKGQEAAQRSPLTKQIKRGLAHALRQFDAYQLAKYRGEGAEVTLRDVLFLTHPRPKNAAQAALWKQLANKQLQPADTWETALSAGANKKETFERLIQEGRLGYLALLRNLRNMEQAGCDALQVRGAILALKGAARVLPFRFIAAAKHAVQFEPALDEAMQKMLAGMPKLPGRTLLLMDNSGSMYTNLSSKSDLMRADAAAGLAILLRGVCEDCRVFAFSDHAVEVPARSGMALREVIQGSTTHGGTMLGAAVTAVQAKPHDRLIVVTDEQSHDPVPGPLKADRAYLINVASYKHGVGYGPWVHIDGWSEAVVRFIMAHEGLGHSTSEDGVLQ